MNDIKEFIFNGVFLGKTCEKCRGQKFGYKTYLDAKGERRYVTIPTLGRGQDYIREDCTACRGKGVIDSEEGAVLRQWLGK